MDKQELKQWAASHETHEAVAAAIHQFADDNRSPQEIWEDPTEVEVNWVLKRVGLFAAAHQYGLDEDFERVEWGATSFPIAPPSPRWRVA